MPWHARSQPPERSRHWSQTSRQSRWAAEDRQVRGTVKGVPVHSDSHRDTWSCRWRGDTFLTGTWSSYRSSDQRLAIYVISLAAFECGIAKRKCSVSQNIGRRRTLWAIFNISLSFSFSGSFVAQLVIPRLWDRENLLILITLWLTSTTMNVIPTDSIINSNNSLTN